MSGVEKPGGPNDLLRIMLQAEGAKDDASCRSNNARDMMERFQSDVQSIMGMLGGLLQGVMGILGKGGGGKGGGKGGGGGGKGG